MIWRKKSAGKLPVLEDLSLDSLPVLTSNELFLLLGLHNKLRSIQRIVGIDTERYEVLYLQPIKCFCELAQLAPASADYHHTGPGGLISHTIGMIELALHNRRKYELPVRSDPEIQQHQKHAWTYSVFVAALLHDVGKLVTLSRFKLNNGQLFNAYGQTKLSKLDDTYQLVFVKAPYKLHQRLSGTFFQLIPRIGQEFIGQHLDILSQLMGFFNDDPFEWGSIGEIVRLADQQSVSDSLKLGNRKRFPNAPSSPLHERLVTALRQLIREGALPINRPGAAIWVKGEYTYLLSKAGVDAMRDYLLKQNVTDIPSDNLRIFDSLQQFGYAIGTPEGRAIWQIKIHLANGFNQIFTALKFDTNRLFHPSKLPEDLKGVIFESEADLKHEDKGHSMPPVNTTNKNAPEQNAVTKKQDHPDLNQQISEVDKSKTANLEPSKELGQEFIDWVKNGVQQKRIILNQDLVHVLNYKNQSGEIKKVAGIISPKSFNDFAESIDLSAGKPHEVIQKSVHKLKLAIKNGRYHIHKYRIKSSPSAKAVLQFYVFELDLIIPEELDINVKVNDSLVFMPTSPF